MGLSSKKQTSSGTSKSTTTMTPTNPAWAVQPFKDYASQVQSFTNSNPTMPAIGPTANQTAAFAGAGGLLTPNAGIGDGMNASRGLLDFAPAHVTAGQVRNTDLSGYTDPWETAVVDSALSDIERTRAGAISEGQGRATMSGAYGGSRHGVADAGTNEAALRAAAATSAALRSAGYKNAQQVATSDIDRRLGADEFNATGDMAGAGLRLGAAAQLGGQGIAADESRRADLGLLSELGADERQIELMNSPVMRQLMALAAQQGLLGGIPLDAVSGRTVVGDESYSGQVKQGTSGLEWLNAFANLISSYPSPSSGG